MGCIKRQLQYAKEIIHQLEIASDSKALSSMEEWFRCKLKCHALGLASLEHTMARMRSRLGWIKEGDTNTSYFQQHARYCKRKNFIAKVQVGEQIIMAHEAKQKAVWDFYSPRLGTAAHQEHTRDLSVFYHPPQDLCDLEKIFTEDEVWSTIKPLPVDKAPSSDGFIGRFYKIA